MTASAKIVDQYSVALFSVAKKNKKEEKILQDLSKLKLLFQTFYKAFSLIGDPIYKDSIRFDFIEKIGKKERFDKLTINFLKVLATKKRLKVIDNIIEKYQELNYSSQHIEKIEVVSVVELTKKQILEIEEFFKKNFHKKVWIDNTIDADIIGGIMIKVGSVIFDNSFANKLNRLKLFIEQEIAAAQ